MGTVLTKSKQKQTEMATEGQDAGPSAAKKTKFPVFSDEEIKKKQYNQIPKNTLKSESFADTIFNTFLQEKPEIVNRDYWVWPDDELDKVLVKS